MKKILIITLVILTAVSVGYYRAQAEIQGSPLIAWFNMDNNRISGTTLTDVSGNGITGTLTNGPVSGSAGKMGQAITFDGTDDYVNVANNTILNSASAMTVSAWVRSSSLGGGGVNFLKYILNREQTTGSPGATVFILRAAASGSATPNRYEFYAGGAGYVGAVTANNSIVLGAWQLVTGTYDGANVNIYLNGVLIQSSPKTGNTGTDADNLEIGRYASGADQRYWNGLIDEARIYNRALSAAEVAQLYQSTAGNFSKFNSI